MSHTNKDSTNVNPESKDSEQLLASFIQKKITRSEFCKLWLSGESVDDNDLVGDAFFKEVTE